MIPQISMDDFREVMRHNQPQVIDVREQFEYVDGHVPGATWIPMALVPLRSQDFAGADPAYVICRTGNRSGQVVSWLANNGIHAINVDGGTLAWQRAGEAVATGMDPGVFVPATDTEASNNPLRKP